MWACAYWCTTCRYAHASRAEQKYPTVTAGRRLGLGQERLSKPYSCDRDFSTGDKVPGPGAAALCQTVSCTRPPPEGKELKSRPQLAHPKSRKGIFFKSTQRPIHLAKLVSAGLPGCPYVGPREYVT